MGEMHEHFIGVLNGDGVVGNAIIVHQCVDGEAVHPVSAITIVAGWAGGPAIGKSRV